MARIQKASEILGLTVPPLRDYENGDFNNIHRKLSCYWEHRDGYIEFNKKKFYEDCGAMTEKGEVIVQNFRYEKNKKDEYVARCDEPTRLSRAYKLLDWYIPAALFRGIQPDSKQVSLNNDEPF